MVADRVIGGCQSKSKIVDQKIEACSDKLREVRHFSSRPNEQAQKRKAAPHAGG